VYYRTIDGALDGLREALGAASVEIESTVCSSTGECC